MYRRVIVLMIVILAVMLTPSRALANSASNRFGEFYGGLLHTLTALEHLLPIIALGLFAGQHGPKFARCCLIAFPAGLLIGLVAASGNSPSPFVSRFNLTSFVVLGVLVAGSFRQPLVGLIGLAFIFGLSHGYESVVALDAARDMYLFAGGVSLTGLFLMAIPAAIVVSIRHKWQLVAVRLIGICVAAMGVMMFAIQ